MATEQPTPEFDEIVVSRDRPTVIVPAPPRDMHFVATDGSADEVTIPPEGFTLYASNITCGSCEISDAFGNLFGPHDFKQGLQRCTMRWCTTIKGKEYCNLEFSFIRDCTWSAFHEVFG